MKKAKLKEEVEKLKTGTQTALQMVIDELNQGQRKKIVQNEVVKALLDRYGVSYE